MIATGVRWAESAKRRGREAFEYLASTKAGRITASTEVMLANDNDTSRRLIEKCEMKAKTVCNPIIDWKDSDVWDFYWHECKHHNPLYQMGYTRVGCIGCPLAGKKERKSLRIFRHTSGHISEHLKR